MKFRIFKDEEILDKTFRAKVIKEIDGTENQIRRGASRKRYDVYRDQVQTYVRARLKKELKAETVEVMMNRASLIPFSRKIVNKLAQSYASGVERTAQIQGEKNDELSKKVSEISRLIKLNKVMKKSDRYSELDRICTVQIVPEKCESENDAGQLIPKMRPKAKVIPAYAYDVIEDGLDPEKARCYILSDFLLRPEFSGTSTGGADGVRVLGDVQQGYRDGQDEVIADSKDDSNPNEQIYIWWTANYHFTTNNKGEYNSALSPIDFLNPIQELPFVDVCGDRDGYYWPDGGDDITEGTILLNIMLTDIFTILNHQGWGQLVMAARKMPDNINVGPNKAIQIETQEGETTPLVQYIQANAPIDAWLNAIEQYLKMWLSSNNLSTSSSTGNLSARNAASGISKLVDDAELVGTVEEKQLEFCEVERAIFSKYAKWHNLLIDEQVMDDDFEGFGKLEDFEVNTKFATQKPVLSEAEHVDILTKRKALAINTFAELLILDNPDLSKEEADQKAAEVLADHQKFADFWTAKVQAAQGFPQQGQAGGQGNLNKNTQANSDMNLPNQGA